MIVLLGRGRHLWSNQGGAAFLPGGDSETFKDPDVVAYQLAQPYPHGMYWESVLTVTYAKLKLDVAKVVRAIDTGKSKPVTGTCSARYIG